MNRITIGISLFFIVLIIFLYKTKEHFFGYNAVYANNIKAKCSADSVDITNDVVNISEPLAPKRVKDTRFSIPLTDSSDMFEQHPELVLPIPKTEEYMKKRYDMSVKKNQSEEEKERNIIEVYTTRTGNIQQPAKIGFKKSEIEKIYGEQLEKFKKKPKTPWEQSEYKWAKFMVPITWKAMANQYGQLKRLAQDVKNIKKGLDDANITLHEIDNEVKTLQ